MLDEFDYRPLTREALEGTLREASMALQSPMDRLIPYSRLLVCAQKLEAPVQQITLRMHLRTDVAELLTSGQGDQLAGLLIHPCVRQDREELRELLGVTGAGLTENKNAEISQESIRDLRLLQDELFQNGASDRDETETLKDPFCKWELRIGLDYLLHRARSKVLSFDQTTTDEALVAACNFAQQEGDLPWRIRKLFLVAQTARECRRGELARDFAITALRICLNQPGEKTGSMPSLDTRAFEGPCRPGSKLLHAYKKPARPMPKKVEKLRELIVQFLKDLQADLEHPG